MNIKTAVVFMFAIAALYWSGCNKENDTENPKINLVSPQNCDSILQGQFIKFEVNFSDNIELAKYAVDIHNNFKHQSYAPTDQGCEFGPDKTEFNPFKYAVFEDITPGLTTYSAAFKIIVPEGTDTGDYFMVVYIQDKKGLQSQHSISLKFYNNDRAPAY